MTGYVFLKPNHINLKFNQRGFKAQYNVFLEDGKVHALNKVKIKTVKQITSDSIAAAYIIYKLELDSSEGV